MSHEEYAFERFVKVLEEIFQKYGSEVLDEIDELEKRDKMDEKNTLFNNL